MKIIKNGESGRTSTSVNVSDRIAECHHTTVHASLPDGARFQMHWLLDFSNISEADLIAAAAEHFKIKIRRDFAKDEKPRASEWDSATFDVSKYVTHRVDKTAKLAREMAKLSPEDREALLAMVGEMSDD